MKRRILLGLAVTASTAVGCFQTIDNGVSIGGPMDSTAIGSLDGGATDARSAVTVIVSDAAPTLPDAFGGADLDAQCTPGSALCFQICGSPECATQDKNGIPVLVPTLQTPGVLLPEGGLSADVCTALEAESMVVRERSCSGCHGPPPAPAPFNFNFVLDDSKLVGGSASTGQILVKPGDPTNSYIYQRMFAGVASPTAAAAMPPTPCGYGTQICNTLVYPSAEDLSIMYAWILNCAGGDGGAFNSSYYGGNYGPGGDSGGPPSATPLPKDAGGGG